MTTLLQQLLELTQPPVPGQAVAQPAAPAPGTPAPAPAPATPSAQAPQQQQQDDPHKGLTVAVHKAYAGKVKEIMQDLQTSHAGGSSEPLKTTEQGDYVHIHLDKTKDYNTPAAIALTLKNHEGHGGYKSSKNIMVNGKSYDAEQD